MSKQPSSSSGSLVLVLAVLIPWLAFRSDGDAATRRARRCPPSLKAGQSLFQTNCGTCHTLYAAGTDGNYGAEPRRPAGAHRAAGRAERAADDQSDRRPRPQRGRKRRRQQHHPGPDAGRHPQRRAGRAGRRIRRPHAPARAERRRPASPPAIAGCSERSRAFAPAGESALRSRRICHTPLRFLRLEQRNPWRYAKKWAKTIGIDLGTTNSCVAVMEGGEPTVLENAEGGRTTPSVVAFTECGERLVGTVAKRQAVMNPENTIFSIKRFMGRKEAEVKEEETIVPYKVEAGPNGDVRVDVRGKQYSPPEISAMILQKLKADAEAKLGETVDSAVITVPAYFNDDQRQATKDAGKIAGLDVKRIINEPTAASLAYGLDKEKADQTILVFDLGGGTFDVSVLEIGDGVFEVKSTAGDNHLGGDNWDKAIVEWLVAEFKRDQGVDLAADKNSLQRLYEAAEKAKIELSSTQETQINLPFITAVEGQPKHLDLKLSRSKLNELTADLLERIVGPVKRALDDADADDRPRRPGRRHDPDARRARAGQGADRQGPAPGRQPGRGRRRRRRDPGRRAGRRRQGRAAARRHPADPRDRDQRRRDDEADRAQHDDPDEEVGDLLDRRRQPALGRDPRAPGRARDGQRQQEPGQVPAHRHPAGAARACRRSRSPSTSTPTASSTSPPKTKAPAKSRRSRSNPAPASPTRKSRAWSPTPSRTPRRTASSASWPRPATSPRTPPTSPRKRSRTLGDKVDAATKEEIEAAIKEVRESLDVRAAPRRSTRRPRR